MKTGLKVIITGATGMVGEGVLLVCLQDPTIEKVLVINRKSIQISHPKLEEIIHPDFFDLSPIEGKLAGYDACFFCLGISSVGTKKDEYFRITYELTMHVAKTLSRQNKDLVFCYVSGAGTDSTEKGSRSWARVKGKTENDLQKLPFAKSYGMRPAFIKPVEGQKQVHSFYKYVDWLFPIGRKLYPNGFCTMKELANSMIYLAKKQPRQPVISGTDIIQFGSK